MGPGVITRWKMFTFVRRHGSGCILYSLALSILQWNFSNAARHCWGQKCFLLSIILRENNTCMLSIVETWLSVFWLANLGVSFKRSSTSFLPQYDIWHLDWSDSCCPDSGTKRRPDWPHLGGWSECYWNHYCSGGDAILYSASTDHSPGCYRPLRIQGKLIHTYINLIYLITFC